MSLPPRRVDVEAWAPVGVSRLESNALKVVRSTGHRSVLAGPGAGKTELLAQRAAYLLQTGACPAPQRILAIAFKRDAAQNLALRVAQRCQREHASRLDSVTFDAFAKNLLHRFGQALPPRWRPTPDYDILFPKADLFREFLRSASESRDRVGTAGRSMPSCRAPSSAGSSWLLVCRKPAGCRPRQHSGRPTPSGDTCSTTASAARLRFR